MSAFANNPWVKKDKDRATGINSEPEIKKPTKNPRKISKNPFSKGEDEAKKEPFKPKPKVSFHSEPF
jgi:hypothetical protein